MTTETETQTVDTETTTAEAPKELTPNQAKDALYGEAKEETTTDEAKEETTTDEAKEETTGDDAKEETTDADSEEKTDDADKPYKLKFDETLDVSDDVKSELEAFGKENGVDPDKMQGIVKQIAERQQEQVTNVVKGWQDESLTDKEFGGEAYESNIKVAAKPLQKYGSEKLVEILEQTGLNSNPEVIRVFYRIGKAMSEGESIDTAKATAEPDILTKLYGPSTGK